ncbi:MAG TPA: molecular chaperone HtpG [Alphaproteobacteria bacterium]|nr:molecular chaperone HtpG [Alphaproteobacteria bacterium]
MTDVNEDAKLPFQAEVSRLLDIVAHSLYSEKEVFLRELISNASDACDRLRYAAIAAPELTKDGAPFEIRLIVDKEARTLTIADTGIGMNRDELIENLGTIARSGTSAFLTALGEAKKDVSLIGQFGVGFYAAFMVADRVEVVSRHAGEAEAWRWASEGKGEFRVGPAAGVEGRGTRITLHLREGEDEFLEEWRLRQIVARYSDHIPLPIRFGEGTDAPALNRAGALWMRPKSEITEEQYKEFYHHAAHAFDEPWMTLHWRAEGVIDYAALLFVPKTRPLDLSDPTRKHGVKLYVKRVFITEGTEGLVPAYLRFLRGVVDSEDLPLNISREMLQLSPVLSKIRAGITKRVLSEVAKRAENESEYAEFWGNFGAILKEGLYEDRENRAELFKAVRFRSTHGEGLVSLADYVSRMRPGQEAIYYVTGDSVEALRASPHIEGFAARGVEVLLLTDSIDEFWPAISGEYEGKPLRSATRAGADLEKIEPVEGKKENEAEKPPERETATLIALIKTVLGDRVKDVRASAALTESAVRLVAADDQPDIHLERLLRQHGQIKETSPHVLEINPSHKLMRELARRAAGGGVADALADRIWLLLDQARIAEGDPVLDATAFARRLAAVLEAGLAD